MPVFESDRKIGDVFEFNIDNYNDFVERTSQDHGVNLLDIWGLTNSLESLKNYLEYMAESIGHSLNDLLEYPTPKSVVSWDNVPETVLLNLLNEIQSLLWLSGLGYLTISKDEIGLQIRKKRNNSLLTARELMHKEQVDSAGIGDMKLVRGLTEANEDLRLFFESSPSSRGGITGMDQFELADATEAIVGRTGATLPNVIITGNVEVYKKSRIPLSWIAAVAKIKTYAVLDLLSELKPKPMQVPKDT